MASLQVGLIGFGLGGRVFHAPTIHGVSGLQLAAILERSGNNAKAEYPDVPVVRRLEELLAIDSIKLIVVTTPNPTHYDLVSRCLRAGRDVVVDKPFAGTYVEAVALARIAQECGRFLTVYQNRRFDGDFLTVRNLLKEGSLGRLVHFESNMERYRPAVKSEAWRELPKPASGMWFDLGPHLVDQAFVLFGLPEAITAELRCEREGAVVDDAFDVVFHYPGLRVQLRSNLLSCVAAPRFRLNGTKGSFLKYGLDPQEEALKRGEKPGGANWGEDPEENWGMLSVADGDKVKQTRVPTIKADYRGYYENVRDAIVSGAPAQVSLQDALHVMRALELAVESSRRQCTMPFGNAT